MPSDFLFWLVVIIVAVLAVMWVRANFYISELTPAPPWVKLARKQKVGSAEKSATVGDGRTAQRTSDQNTSTAEQELSIGKNEIDIDGKGAHAEQKLAVGKNKISINTSGRKGGQTTPKE